MNDGKIIELFFERSDEAITELSEKYGRLAISLARNILGDEGDAEECVNDAYLAAWNNIPPEQPLALGAYLCGIVRNLSYSRLRRQSAAKRRPEALIALEELSEVTSYNYSYLSALFRRVTSSTLAEYFRSRRLETARLLLEERRMSITKIAEILNYSSIYTFSRAFKDKYGLSPEQYRRNI